MIVTYQKGSDFFTVYIRSTDAPLSQGADGARPSHDDKRLSDQLRFVKFSTVAWTHDNLGFFYQACLCLQLQQLLSHVPIALPRPRVSWLS